MKTLLNSQLQHLLIDTQFAYIQPSRGLGAVVAEKFAAEGSNVAINFANQEEPAVKLAERLKKDYGVKTTVIRAVCIFRGRENGGI
jgi:hypothetical protein